MSNMYSDTIVTSWTCEVRPTRYVD